MLELPGFLKADTFELDDDENGKARRVVHYHIATDADLQAYLGGPASSMRQSAVDRFSDRIEVSRRVLRRVGDTDGTPRATPACLNCGTPLRGQYCGRCGQRARSRLISFWELLRDAFGDLFELDSRLWRTLIPLVLSPGRLTRDYLLGRRVRYMPPFRTYLVLSVVFFLVAFFDPREELSLLFEAQGPSAEPTQPADRLPGDDTGTPDSTTVKNDGSINCEFDDFDAADTPEWLSKRITPARLRLICERIQADSGRALVKKLLDNIPAALFFLLPLMALALKLLYPLSKRYYAEHLLFVVHYHAFFFLMLTLQIVFARLASIARVPDSAADVVIAGTSLYIPIYLFRAMQRVYGQGALGTTFKFIFLAFSYIISFSLMIAFAAAFAAFSI